VDRSGRDLLVAVRRGAGSLRAQLEEQLRDDVRAGRLRPGKALPSTRVLARDLGVSRGVVVEAYAQVAAEGLIVTLPGGTTRVAPPARVEPLGPPGPSVRWDFRVEAGDLGAFPRRAWLAALGRALATAPDAALSYGDRAGAPVLREALAGYLGRARGVVADPARLVITAGATQGVALLARVLVARGVRRMAVERPGFPLHAALLARAGVEVVGVPVDDEGLVVDALPSGVGAVLVTPAHQFPMGVTLSAARRAALLARDLLVIEDDYDGEFGFDDGPAGSLQGRAPERVAYLGSASKALVPGLRLGWAVLPGELAVALTEEKTLADGGSPVLEQLALADLIGRGDLDRHLRRVRARHRRRRDALVTAVAEELPGARLSGAHAGLHAIADLGPGHDVPALLARAWTRGVGVVGFEHERRAILVLGWANAPEPSIAPGLRELARAVA